MKLLGKRSGRSLKSIAVTELLLALAIIIVLNLLGTKFYSRLDLTKEKRYTLSQSSKALTGKLDDVLSVTVYLEGDFPAGFKRLRNATREMLDEFRIVSGGHIEYEFVNILKDKDKQSQRDILQQLIGQGLQPTTLETDNEAEKSEKIIIPGAIANYKGKAYAINLLKGQFGGDPEEVINQSIEMLEYEIGNALRKCVSNKAKTIAFLSGHGELPDEYLADIRKELGEFYSTHRLNINIEDTNCLKRYRAELLAKPDSAPAILVTRLMEDLQDFDAIVVAKPTIPFNDVEKYLLDQYVMHGGKVIWLIDELIAELDSMQKYGNIMTADYQLRLDDMLFKYGARLNANLIQDLQCHVLPFVKTSTATGQPQRKFYPWIFYPVFIPDGSHPIVRNLEGVWSRFGGSLDTVGSKKINKTVLLHSSPYSRVAGNPVNLAIDMIPRQVNPAAFHTDKPKISAVLLSGTFESVFKYRSKFDTRNSFNFKPSIDSNSMIVIADGDIIANQVQRDGQYFPLGFDRYTRMTFGNRKFIMNCVDYLCDASGLIEVRSKEITLRRLDKNRLKKQAVVDNKTPKEGAKPEEETRDEKVFWQTINMVVPVVLVLLFAFVNHWIRLRRYAR